MLYDDIELKTYYIQNLTKKKKINTIQNASHYNET